MVPEPLQDPPTHSILVSSCNTGRGQGEAETETVEKEVNEKNRKKTWRCIMEKREILDPRCTVCFLPLEWSGLEET
jgi:hypothetical protein